MNNGNFVLYNIKNVKNSIRKWIAFSCFCLVLTVVTLGYLQFNVIKSLIILRQKKYSLITKINKQIPLTKQQALLQCENQAIINYTSKYLIPAFAYKEIEIIAENMPPDVCLNKLNYKANGQFTLLGQAKSSIAITLFIHRLSITRLSGQKEWKKVELKQLTKMSEDSYIFEIRIE